MIKKTDNNRFLSKSTEEKEDVLIELNKFITEESIVFMESKEIEDTIELLVDRAYSLGKIKNKEKILNAFLERESIVSTGIGLGVALPHVKLEEIDEFFIIMGILKNKINWNSIDNEFVSAVFLIGGPIKKQKKYLQIISKLILLIKNKGRREKLFNSTLAKEVTDLFKTF